MENHIIIKEGGSILPWTNNRLNKKFCLLYHDNNQKYIFTPQTNLKCKLFMIAGGGAGGYYFGGGGGAGAAYINDNFTFEQGKTYTFSIGTGGSCDIKNFDKLFNSGLSLSVYNNTSPNLNNISFTYDDYSSLGITSSGIMQSFIVNNITINPTIFNTNTTYIWSGYIKSTVDDKDNTNTDKIISIRFNSKIKSIIWFDTYSYTFDNKLISSTGETHIQEVKILQLDPNRYYNIKIIAYNYDTANNANFNVEFVNCKLYNYNKTYENYNVESATDTTMTFKTVSSNENNVITCKGGGTGGFGLYNQNKDLNGGCGGGSGINKIKGVSTNNNPIYNGTDGAVGSYCGGGGGIISHGDNNKGGEGKIIKWFDETLLFGAGGNGANNKEVRKLGYGCGGNGGDCCYFSKSIINNNGNNGCILICADDDITEHFTAYRYSRIEETNRKTTNYLTNNPNAIASKLIDESFQIANYSGNFIPINYDDRKDYFGIKASSFVDLSVDDTTAGTGEVDNNNMNNFIYDVLVISKIYAISYRLLYEYYTVKCAGDITKFATFMQTAKIQFKNSNVATSQSEVIKNGDNNIIIFNNLFSIENLKLNSPQSKTNYKDADSIYVGVATGPSGAGCPNIKAETFKASIKDICGTDESGFHIPAYHDVSGSNAIRGFNLFYTKTNSYANGINKINPTSTANNINTYQTVNTNAATSINIEFCIADYLTRESLTKLYDSYTTNTTETNISNLNKYEYTRVLLYLEAFNNILNTNSYVTLLPMLKYQMFNYNAIIYNVILQYEIFNYQNSRVALNSDNTAFIKPISSAVSPTSTPTSETLSSYKDNFDFDVPLLAGNLNKIIEKNINTPDNVKDTINEMVGIINTNSETTEIFKTNQTALNESINKYNAQLENNNNLLYYYKVIIIIALFLVLVIFFIFTLNSIDNNTKIGIYIIMIIVAIILLVYYSNNFVVSEKFTIALNKTEADTAKIFKAGSGATLNYSTYKTALIDYNNKILKIMASASVNKDMLFPIKVFSDKAATVRNNKAEYYKLKKINLDTGIEILKKSTNDYYYYMILIIVGIIILIFSLILLLLNPEMLIQVIAFAAICVIILIYYITYNTNRSTRLAENKNYWANFNPSKSTIDGL